MSQVFLFTTTHHLLALDGQDRVYRIHSGKGLYYGLAKDDDGHLFVACRNQIEGPQDELARSRETGSILVLDASSLAVVDELRPEFPLRDVHGIACIDGKLWVTCSFDNLIAVYDFAAREWTKWYPATDPAARARDVNHFNTITAAGERICILAHNNGPSHLLFYAKPSLELCSAVELGCQAHDVFPVDGGMGTCSSRDGFLLSTTGWILRTGAFPRGVAFGESSVLLGISQIALRAARHKASGILRRFTPDWRHLEDYVLSEVGMILAILPVPVDENRLGELDQWQVQRCPGAYNALEPGDVYKVGEGEAAVFCPEWHAGEHTHRWTAAREARMTVVVNPGETKIVVRARNEFPGPYRVEVCANSQSLGSIGWSQPGESGSEFLLPCGAEGRCEILFRVPHLWRPSARMPGSTDERMLGVGVLSVQVC